MSTEDNKANIRRGYEEGFNQRNLAVFDELMAPDYVWHMASTTLQGREPAKQIISRFLTAFPDGRFTIEDMIAEADKVVVRQTFRGTHQGDFSYFLLHINVFDSHIHCHSPENVNQI